MTRLTRDTSSGKFVPKGEAKKRPATTVQERVVPLTRRKVLQIQDNVYKKTNILISSFEIKAVIAAYRKL